MSLLVDFNRLERAVGRDGLDHASLESDIAYAVNWSKSVAAERYVLHAFAIQDRVYQMRLSTEPAMHVPHCVFLAGITSFICLRFRRPAMLARYPPQNQPPPPRSSSDFPEFNMHGELGGDSSFDGTPVLFEDDRGELFMRTFVSQRPVVTVGGEVFRHCADALNRMGHFEIARSYSKTLTALVYVEVEKWMDG